MDPETKAKKTREDLKKASEPLMKFINDNFHPYVTVIVTPTSVELLEGILAETKIYDYLND